MSTFSHQIFAPNSLYGTRKGKVIAFAGASNVLGFDEGSFGTNPYTLRSGVTFYNSGVNRTVTGYLTPHGPEVGLVETLYAANPAYISGLTIMKRAVAGATLQNWIDTHAAALIADCVTAGVTPNVFVMTIQNTETTLANAVLLENKLITLFNIIRLAWGQDIGIILDGPISEDDISEPGNDQARLITRKKCGALDSGLGEVNGQFYWSDAHEDLTNLQITHRNHDAQMLYGARIANAPGFKNLLI